MSSYRKGGDANSRPGPTRSQRARNYERSRRRASPDNIYHGPSREPVSLNNADGGRGWSDRGDYDLPRDYDRRYDRRSNYSHERRDYRDRDRAGYHSPPYSGRSRSRSFSPRRRSRSRSPAMGRPSREIKLDGFPTEMTEAEIRSELEFNYNVAYLEDVRIIRDKKTGRVYAFISFPNVDLSRAFMDQNFPTIRLGISIPEGASGPAKVEIAYSRQERDRIPDREWVCRDCRYVNYRRDSCVRCHAPGPFAPAVTKLPPQKRPEVGNKDASPDETPSQILLVRQLEPNASEDVLAKGVEKLYKGRPDPGTNNATSEKPKAKVISTTSTTNLGAPEGSLLRVFLIRDKETNESWRYGFAEFYKIEDAKAAMTKFKAMDSITVSSKPITLAYAHSGIFMPTSSEDTRFTFKKAAGPAQSFKYWVDDAYASELVVGTLPSDPPNESTEMGANSATMTNIQNTTQDGKEKETKSRKRKAESEATSTKKKAFSQFGFWEAQSAKLHGHHAEKGKSNSDERSKEPSSDTIPPAIIEVPTSLIYGDPNKKCCYLCRRKFKTISEIRKHERVSTLHRENLKNTRTKLTAVALVRKFVRKLASGASQTSAYRDRAAERRQTYNQPKKAPAPIGFKMKAGPAAERSPSPNEPVAAPSKGASLLEKMGYVEGQGLGASGEGRTAPIETEMYREGVGLGAEGSKIGDAAKEAGRNTRGNYEEWMERNREKAQERFNSLK